MAIEIVMPKIGLNMEEGLIVEWIKKVGDPIKRGDVLFILETDKVTVESEAQQDGSLVKILVPEGKRVSVRTPVALMALDGETYVENPEGSSQAGPSPAPQIQQLPEIQQSSRNLAPDPVNGQEYIASPKAKKN